MFTPDKILSACVLVICLIALARLCVGARWRRRFDNALRRVWLRLRSIRLRRKPPTLSADEAAWLARDAIERARQRRGQPSGQWQGNVFRPRSFKRPDKPH